MVVLVRLVLAELEERLGPVLALDNGLGSSLGLSLGGLSGVVGGELGREVGGESGCLGLGRERVRLDGTDVGVLGLCTGQRTLCRGRGIRTTGAGL